MMLFVGDDWAQDHHDVYLMDEAGAPIGGPSTTGRVDRHRAVPRHDPRMHADEPNEVIVGGIEKDHGLWVGALAASG